jgi:hypothetical protein
VYHFVSTINYGAVGASLVTTVEILKYFFLGPEKVSNVVFSNLKN